MVEKNLAKAAAVYIFCHPPAKAGGNSSYLLNYLLLCLILNFLLNFSAFSQYYSSGQDPAAIRWRQIKTEKYQLIFPESFEKKAQYLANIMDLVVKHETTTLKAKVPRIPVVLHNQSALSNGFTVWAPKRIEMYSCSPQETYAEEWLEQLAIHEYRHAVQISKINRGFSRALYYIFGEQITGGILGLYVPSWFLEGDATATETALTKTGRGRSAMFESDLRAQICEKGAYSYDKATLGSYKTYTPDAYSLGYYIVAQTRKMYGADVWNEALDRVAKYPFMVVPFNSGIRKTTGLWKTELYRQSLEELDTAWQRQLRATHHPQVRYITKRNPKNFTTYGHPLMVNDSTILADKSSMDDVSRFVLIDRKTGKEKRLLTPGSHISGTTSIGGDWLVWSEFESGKRWQNRSFAEIRMYNFTTLKLTELTHRTRYFAPIISPNGKMVAAVYISPENRCSIDFIEIPTGRVIRKYPIPEGGIAITPNWSPGSRKIIFTLLTEKGETVAELDTSTGRIHDILPSYYNEFNGPAWFYKQYIIYSVDYSGVENLYALDTITDAKYKITSSRFAAYDPDFTSDKKFMIYSDYTSDGGMAVETPIDTATWIPIHKVDDHSIRLSESLASQENVNIQDSALIRKIYKMNQRDDFDLTRDSIKGTIYPVRRYSKAGHLFNPHSWAPVSFDINNMKFKPGVMVLSQNALSSMFADAGWEYDMNEQTGKFYAGLSYQGLYPVFDLRFDIGNRAGWAYFSGSNELFRFTWQETNLKFLISIPWNFSHARYSRRLQPSVGATLIGIKHNASTPEQFTSGSILTIDYRLTGSQYLRSNQKDVFPRFGQDIDLNYRSSPFGGNNMGTIFSAAANLYFPGIFRHQGISIYVGYQQQRDKDDLVYSYSNFISTPRGMIGVADSEMVSLQFNYKFPILYPDFSIGSVLYLKRVKMNLFYDWTKGLENQSATIYQSTGAELTFDFHLLRFVAPFEMGVRTLYYPDSAGWGWEFLYSIGIP